MVLSVEIDIFKGTPMYGQTSLSVRKALVLVVLHEWVKYMRSLGSQIPYSVTEFPLGFVFVAGHGLGPRQGRKRASVAIRRLGWALGVKGEWP